MLFSATRALQSSAMLAQLDQNRVELHRKLQATDDRRRISLRANAAGDDPRQGPRA